MKNLTTVLMNYLRMFITRVFQTGLNNLTKKITNQLNSKKHTNQTPLAFLIVGLLGVSAKAQTYQWATTAGGTGSDAGLAITKDATGNIYSTGYFVGSVDFDPGSGTAILNSSLGSIDCFIQKLSPSGSLIWVKQIGAGSNDFGRAIKIDNLGNVLIGGSFRLAPDFDSGPGTTTLTSNGFDDAFILKLDNSGNFIWAKSFGAANGDFVYSIATGSNNEVVVGGSYDGTVDFDPGAGTYTLSTGTGAIDACVLKLDASGNFVWAGGFGSPIETDQANAVDVDAAGNVYSTGFFKGTVDFDFGAGSFSLTAAGSNAIDCFITKYSSNGSFLWAKKIGGTSADAGATIKSSPTGNLYIGGYFTGLVDLDPGAGTFTVSSSAGLDDGFLIKLDPSGNFVWAKTYGSSNSDNISSIDEDLFGNIYCVGNFMSTVDFDPGPGTYTLAAVGNKDIFVSKLDNNGNFVFAAAYGTSALETPYAFAVDNVSNIYTTGAYTGTLDLNPGIAVNTFTSIGGNDIFIQKLNGCTSPSVASINTPSNNLIICEGQSTNLIATSSGSVSWYNVTTGGTSLFNGLSFLTPTLAAGTYTYYAEAVTCTNSISRAAVTVTVANCTSINKITSNNSLFKVYPNPVNGTSVIVEVEKDVELNVINALGQVIIVKNLNSGSNTINISELHSGVYYLKVSQHSQNKTIKLIKQ